MTREKHVKIRAHRATLAAIGACLAAVLSAPATRAQTDPMVHYVVTTTTDPFTGDPLQLPDPDGVCSLREAIISAARPASEVTDCGPGGVGGRVRITFAGAGRGLHELQDQVILLLPPFVGIGPPPHGGTQVWIDGAGMAPTDARVVLSGRGQHRILYAGRFPSVRNTSDVGELHLSDLTMTRGSAMCAACDPGFGDRHQFTTGGAVFSRAALFTSYRVTYSHNEAMSGAAVFSAGGGAAGTTGGGGDYLFLSSTFAYNLVNPQMYYGSDLRETHGGTINTHANYLKVRGSTFFHNDLGSAALGPWDSKARDIYAGSAGGGLELGHNVFVAPAGATVRSCYQHSSSTFEWQFTAGLFNRRTGVPGDTMCEFSSASKVDWLLEPVLDVTGNALADHGGWADTVLFTADSEMHDLGTTLPPVCGTGGTTSALFMNSHAWGYWIPAITGWALHWAESTARPTDARGVLRPTDKCDAGAVQREAQQIDFPAPTGAQVGGTLPMPTATSGGPVTLTAEPPSICDVFDDVVRYRAEGSCTVVARQVGTALFRAATPVTRTFDIAPVVKEPRQITFVAVPTAAQVGGSWQIATSVTPDDGSTPIYALGAGSAGCALISDTTVSFTAAGICVVWAGVSETDAYLAASNEVSFSIASAPSVPQAQTITFDPAAPTGVVGTPLTVTAIGGGSGNPVQVAVLSPGKKAAICAVTGTVVNGASTTVTLAFSSTGTCMLEAKQAGSADWEPASARLTINVQKTEATNPPKGPKPK